MNIGVTVKPVFSTNITPLINSYGSNLNIKNKKYIINPFDEYAIEEILNESKK